MNPIDTLQSIKVTWLHSVPTSAMVLLLAGMISSVHAASIGVQRAGGLGGNGTSLTLGQAAGAPGFAQAKWNALSTYATIGTSLIDDTGATTTAGFTATSGGLTSSSYGGPSSLPDEILNSGSQFIAFGDMTFNITGIPYANYSLVFYELAKNPHGSIGTALTGGPTYYLSQTHTADAVGYVDGNAGTPYTYLQATSTSAGSPTVNADYVVFTGLSGASQTVTVQGGFPIENAFNAFQIVQTVPEPGSAMLGGIGALALLLRRRRTAQ